MTLPAPGEAKRAILESFTKEHSAEYQAQAWIDLASRLRTRHPRVAEHLGGASDRDLRRRTIRTSSSAPGSNDPQKYDPTASRETLDHSLPYIFAVALQDGEWHHEHSYARRERRDETPWPCGIGVRTVEDPEWSRRYLSLDPRERRSAVEWRSSSRTVSGSSRRSRCPTPTHGARPFTREQYVEKFRRLAAGIIGDDEQDRFLDAVQRLDELSPTNWRH